MRKSQPYATGRPASPASFSIRRDDVSISAVLDDDPMFWIRLEPGEPATLRLTDLMPGAQAPAVVAAALAAMLPEPASVRRVVLLDVLPDWRDRPTWAVELERRAATARAVVDAAFAPWGRSVGDSGIHERDGKLDLVIALSEADG